MPERSDDPTVVQDCMKLLMEMPPGNPSDNHLERATEYLEAKMGRKTSAQWFAASGYSLGMAGNQSAINKMISLIDNKADQRGTLDRGPTHAELIEMSIQDDENLQARIKEARLGNYPTNPSSPVAGEGIQNGDKQP